MRLRVCGPNTNVGEMAGYSDVCSGGTSRDSVKGQRKRPRRKLNFKSKTDSLVWLLSLTYLRILRMPSVGYATRRQCCHGHSASGIHYPQRRPIATASVLQRL